jgi:hypothetical protein
VEELMAYHYCSLTYISFLFIDDIRFEPMDPIKWLRFLVPGSWRLSLQTLCSFDTHP